MVEISHLYMTTGKTIVLAICTFINKVMSLLFNMLSRFVIAFFPRNKCLLISWLQSPSEVILEPKKIKPVTTSTFSPSICHEVMGPDATILVFWMLSFKPSVLLSSQEIWTLCACSEVSHIWFFVAPWTLSTRFLYPWDFPSKNTGVFFSPEDLPNPGIKLTMN